MSRVGPIRSHSLIVSAAATRSLSSGKRTSIEMRVRHDVVDIARDLSQKAFRSGVVLGASITLSNNYIIANHRRTTAILPSQ